MSSAQRQRPFLGAILKEANRRRRQEMLQHANADQINALSEVVLNLLKHKIPVPPDLTAKLRRYKNTLREIGRRTNSVKKRREGLQSQSGAGFWKSLDQVYQLCLKEKN